MTINKYIYIYIYIYIVVVYRATLSLRDRTVIYYVGIIIPQKIIDQVPPLSGF